MAVLPTATHVNHHQEFTECDLGSAAQSRRESRQAVQADPERAPDLPGLLPRLNDTDEVWCLLEFEFWLYALRNPTIRARVAELYRHFRSQLAPLAAPFASDELEPDEVVAATIALYHGLTLQWHSDPHALRPDLVARVLRAVGQQNAPAPAASTRNGSTHPRENR